MEPLTGFFPPRRGILSVAHGLCRGVGDDFENPPRRGVLSVALGGPKAAQGAKNAGGAPKRAPFPAFRGVSVAAAGKNLRLHGADNQRQRKKSKKRRKKVAKTLARKGKSCNFAAVFAPTAEAVGKRGRAKVL